LLLSFYDKKRPRFAETGASYLIIGFWVGYQSSDFIFAMHARQSFLPQKLLTSLASLQNTQDG
jgi:hypothetical protein